jgi:E3 ubiquitin-protein ligase TRIP12
MVDVRMAKSLDAVQQFADAKLSLVFDDDATEEEKALAYDDVTVNNAALKDFSLDFTLPGSEIELKDGGADIAVDMSNVEEYVRLGASRLSWRSLLCSWL